MKVIIHLGSPFADREQMFSIIDKILSNHSGIEIVSSSEGLSSHFAAEYAKSRGFELNFFNRRKRVDTGERADNFKGMCKYSNAMIAILSSASNRECVHYADRFGLMVRVVNADNDLKNRQMPPFNTWKKVSMI